jgi:hypothetical protein
MVDSPSPLATPEQAKARRSEVETEWGTWGALVAISYNGALAYLPGDPVPASNVARHGYDKDGSVAKQSSKAFQDVIAAIHARVTSDTGVIEQPAPVSLGVTVKD